MKRKPEKTSPRMKRPAGALPLYCDYQCGHASFAPADATGACRREQAVYCSLLGAFNTKNSRCRARDQEPGDRKGHG